jgi:acetylornithine/N-succinyldiaminopimelate aminotransferase
VNRKAGFLRQRLEALVGAHPDIFDSVRGSGLMLGLVCKPTNTDVVAAGYEAGVLTVPAGDNVVRILPALTITEDEIAQGISRLDAAATALERRTAAEYAHGSPSSFQKYGGEREGLAPRSRHRPKAPNP